MSPQTDGTDWTCPNCGDDGEPMTRHGSDVTCANCLHVDGAANDKSLWNYDLTVRQARRVLHVLDEPWNGTPETVEARLRVCIERSGQLNDLLADIRETEVDDAQ
ncbi:hypothetical protein [Halobaculum sp. P14]|uniref:hypothetical protein n=1 Tax=Halobaculum sp. P14 TaxID=3421638 RepID=UPI003EB83376